MKINLQKDISRSIKGCRIDWCVFRLDFISGNGHKTDVLALQSCFNAITIGNQKKKTKKTDSSDKFSTSTLLRAHFLVLYLNRHPRMEHLLNACSRGHAVQYKITYKFLAANFVLQATNTQGLETRLMFYTVLPFQSRTGCCTFTSGGPK